MLERFQENFVKRDQISSENSEPFRSFHPEGRTEIHSSSNGEGLKDLGHKMRQEILVLGVNSGCSFIFGSL